MKMLWPNFEAWTEPVQPPFADIQMIGCCDDHEREGVFQWYREHTWKDLRDLIMNTESMLLLPIDVYSFGSMDPVVKRYYMKGALSALDRQVGAAAAFEELPYEAWQWISGYKDHLEARGTAGLRHDAGFSKQDIEDVIALIENIGRLTFDPAEHHDSHRNEIATTLELWKQWRE